MRDSPTTLNLVVGLAVGFACGVAVVVGLSRPAPVPRPDANGQGQVIAVGVSDETGQAWSWYEIPAGQTVRLAGRQVRLLVKPAEK